MNKNALSFLKHEATPDLMFKIQKKKNVFGNICTNNFTKKVLKIKIITFLFRILIQHKIK